MNLTPQNSNRLETLFGMGYIREQHIEPSRSYLPPPDLDSGVDSLAVTAFERIMQSLRAALSLR